MSDKQPAASSKGAVPKRSEAASSSRTERPRRVAAAKAIEKLTERSKISCERPAAGDDRPKSVRPQSKGAEDPPKEHNEEHGRSKLKPSSPLKVGSPRALSASPTPSRDNHSQLHSRALSASPTPRRRTSTCSHSSDVEAEDPYDESLRRKSKAEALKKEQGEKMQTKKPAEERLFPAVVHGIMKAAENETALKPFHMLYQDVANYNVGDPNVPWLIKKFLKTEDPAKKGRLMDHQRQLRILQFWLGHDCYLSRELRDLCKQKNPEVDPIEVTFVPRVVGNKTEDKSKPSADNSWDTIAEPDGFFAIFDPDYELPVSEMRVAGSERARPVQEYRMHMRQRKATVTALVDKQGARNLAGRRLEPERTSRLPQPIRPAKKRPVKKPLLPYPADEMFGDKRDPLLPDRLLRMAAELGRNAVFDGSRSGAVPRDMEGASAAAKNPQAPGGGLKPKRGARKRDDELWLPLTRNFPNNIEYIEDLFGILVKISQVCWANSLLHMFMDMCAFGPNRVSNVEFLKAITTLSFPVLRVFLRCLFDTVNKSGFITKQQAMAWATLCRKVVETVYEIPRRLDNVFVFEAVTDITPAMMLRILKVRTVDRVYTYAANNDTCRHLNHLRQGDIGLPYYDFSRMVKTGEVPKHDVDHPCPGCGSAIQVKAEPRKEGFFTLMSGFGEAMNRGNVNSILPKSVTNKKFRYELRTILAAFCVLENVGHVTTLVPGLNDDAWSVFDDGCYVKGKGDAKLFAASAMLATYVFKEEVE